MRGHFRHAPAHQQDEVRRLGARKQLRVRANAHLARVVAVRVREQRRAPEGGRDRQVEPLGKAHEGVDGALSPPAAAKDCERRPRGPQAFLQVRHLCEAGPGLHRLDARGVRDRGALDEHVLGQRDHDGTGPALHRDMERPRYDLGYSRHVVDLRRPLRERAEDGAIIHLLKGAAFAHAALDLPDEQDQRGRIMFGDVDRVRGIHRARAARDEDDAWPSGQSRRCLGHERRAGFMPRDRQLDGRIVERVEHGQVGLAGHAEDVRDALRDQLIDEDLTAGAEVGGRHAIRSRPRT